MSSCRAILSAVVIGFSLLLVPMRAQSVADGADVRGSKSIRTLRDIRNDDVVRQRWDISCGAAALSTVLTYDFSDNTPETSIVVWIFHRTNPALIRKRGGFSLLDLKHFAQARGYNAEGFSDMSMADLAAQKSWVIVPIRLKGFDHFVVVKGIVGDRVFIGDPGFGNVTMKTYRFKKIWKNGIAFIVEPPDERMQVAKQIPGSALILPDESLITRGIAVMTPTNGLY